MVSDVLLAWVCYGTQAICFEWTVQTGNLREWGLKLNFAGSQREH